MMDLLSNRWLTGMGLGAWLLVVACGGAADSIPDSATGGDSGVGGSNPPSGGTGGTRLESSGGTGGGNAAGSDGGPCVPGSDSCVYVATGPACGDGELNQDFESCDDRNGVPGDGCTGGCSVENNFECPTPGEACTSTIACGDGVTDGAEICDDGNLDPGDGCSPDCYAIDSGWDCPLDGGPCTVIPDPCDATPTPLWCLCLAQPSLPECAGGVVVPACGDGELNQSGEACDDGNGLPGDGCSGACKIEPYYTCPVAGAPCLPTNPCGDGNRDPGEACDDRNQVGGDGCGADCRTIEDGYFCITPGSACEQLADCGDGRISAGEQCDDGDVVGGDGCSAGCQREDGWRCVVPGDSCEKIAICGDGFVAPGEECDDNGTVPGDGCSVDCRVEASWWSCPHAAGTGLGGVCTNTAECGDGFIEDEEQCDDGNTSAFDGCSATCAVDIGYICPKPNQKCVLDCGDGLRVGVEECDDGDEDNGDGCSASCRREPGFSCTGNPSVCSQTVCGNGVREGGELCDRGVSNGLFYGDGTGCTKACTTEPTCRVGGVTQACTTSCGDGMKLGTEACDDGNPFNGDGCSATCTLESGFDCAPLLQTGTEPCPGNASLQCLRLPVIVRDFKGQHESGGHPDFFYMDSTGAGRSTDCVPNAIGVPAYNGDQNATPLCLNLVTGTLDAEGKPMRNTGASAGNVVGQPGYCQCKRDGGDRTPVNMLFSATSFSQWFRNTAATPIQTTIDLEAIGSNQFRFARLAPNFFFPVDAYTTSAKACQVWPYWGATCGATQQHNYWFTSEARHIFLYRGGESLAFAGDDDVWVFVNGRLAVDLGGTHQQLNGSVTLTGNNFGMAVGNVYEIVVFHADRHPIDSNYQLTLSGFQTERSDCDPDCGDGIVTTLEQCDLGAAANTGAYDGCTASCAFGPYCGDGVVNGVEACDDGKNATVGYGVAGCGPGCVAPPRCGDGTIDPGERCDEGAENRDRAYSATPSCSATCERNPYCGDGSVNGSEACDDGLNVGGYGYCAPGCMLGPRCGDGIVQADFGELCDPLTDPTCTSACGLPGYCGDGIVQPELGETCDDQVNDGSYGGCSQFCQNAPRCGDGVLEPAFEMCDFGADNDPPGAVAYGGCSTLCQVGPYCGDDLVTAPEECELVSNPNCMAGCILGACGNGVIDDGEDCDDAVNDGGYGECAPGCRSGPYCGDANADAPFEQCDDGVNDGGYGQCATSCRLGPYCGDGQVQAPQEQCDDGANDGGYGECAALCRWGLFCGDGTVTLPFELCDDGNRASGDGCSAGCVTEEPVVR